MALTKSGIQAPAFTLPDMEGQKRSLHDLLAQGPILLAFFKVSCPTCQYTLPFLQRLAGSKVSVIGVSQDVRRKTEEFNRTYALLFPALLDSADGDYPVSNAYGITYVPSLFLIEPDGQISLTSVGFAKVDLEEIARRAGPVSLFHRDEKIEAFRAG